MLSNLFLSKFSISEFKWDFDEEGIVNVLLFGLRRRNAWKHELAIEEPLLLCLI
jgi:hypothetical protein